MVKRRTAEKKRRYAEKNGFNDDDDTDIDDTSILWDVLDYSKGKYDV